MITEGLMLVMEESERNGQKIEIHCDCCGLEVCTDNVMFVDSFILCRKCGELLEKHRGEWGKVAKAAMIEFMKGLSDGI